MSVWKPTYGLTRADEIVRMFETEARMAHSLIHPLFAHRMKQVIAEELDHPLRLAAVRQQAELAPPADPDQGYMESLVNGRHEPADDFPAMYADEPSAGTAPVAMVSTVVSGSGEDRVAASPRRGRGRPKGSKGKKKKAKAPEKVAEAPAQETTG